MRQALNNLQSTHEGFGFVKSSNVFKVCDEPHPLLIKDMLGHCVQSNIDEAYKVAKDCDLRGNYILRYIDWSILVNILPKIDFY